MRMGVSDGDAGPTASWGAGDVATAPAPPIRAQDSRGPSRRQLQPIPQRRRQPLQLINGPPGEHAVVLAERQQAHGVEREEVDQVVELVYGIRPAPPNPLFSGGRVEVELGIPTADFAEHASSRLTRACLSEIVKEVDQVLMCINHKVLLDDVGASGRNLCRVAFGCGGLGTDREASRYIVLEVPPIDELHDGLVIVVTREVDKDLSCRLLNHADAQNQLHS